MSTALDTYMKAHDIGDAELAGLIGRDRTMVSKIRRGIVRPTLDAAAAIEAATAGAVRMQAWMAGAAAVVCSACKLAASDPVTLDCRHINCPIQEEREEQDLISRGVLTKAAA